MKKNFFLGFIALAALTVSSCSNDADLTLKTPDNAIEFGTYVGRDAQTRGSVLNNDVATGLPKQGFGVFAYYTDNTDYNASSSPANFMNNTKVTWNSETSMWEYAPVKYWPNEVTDKLSFFAYAPYGAYTVATTGDPILDFTVNPDPTFHVDLVVADASEKKNLTKQNTTDNVQFNFKHVLSRVGFMVEAVIDEVNNQNNGAVDEDNQTNSIAASTTISVQEVELIGTFNTAGKINLNTSLWDNTQMTTAGTSYSLAATDFNDVANNVKITKGQLNKPSEYMMLIPTASPTGVQIRVKYTVTTEDGQLASGYSVVTNNITSDAFNFKFEQGKAYNFVLHLGLTSVKLSATVADWETATDHVVNVPLNL